MLQIHTDDVYICMWDIPWDMDGIYGWISMIFGLLGSLILLNNKHTVYMVWVALPSPMMVFRWEYLVIINGLGQQPT